MKKILLPRFIVVVLLLTSSLLRAQSESAPGISPNDTEGILTSIRHNDNPQIQNLWDIEFNYTTNAGTTNGFAAIVYVDSTFWLSKWASDTIYRFDANGVPINYFIIPGLYGIRSFTYDGTHIYAANNTNIIYRISPTGFGLTGTIVAATAVGNIRWITYNTSLNNNSGGFNVGNFNTDIYSIDMSGNLLSSIPASTHGLTGMYGAAYDTYTPGGPYIWFFTQMSPNNSTVVCVDASTGATITSHDVMSDVGPQSSLTSGLAGGMFVTDQYTPGRITLMGVEQGTPINVMFGYDLANPSSLVDIHLRGVRPEQGYTKIPMMHTFQERFGIDWKNNSVYVIDTARIVVHVLQNNTVQFSDTVVVTNIAPSDSGTAYTDYWQPALLSFFDVKSGVTLGGLQTDLVPTNDSAFTMFEVTDSLFSRDNGIPDSSGYSVSAISWAYTTSNFTLQTQDAVAGIYIELQSPHLTPGDSTYAVLFTTSAGVPGSVIATGVPVLLDSLNSYWYLPFATPVTLPAGEYAFGCYQGVNDQINLGQSSTFYTPNTSHYYLPESGWNVNSIPTAQFIRPVFYRNPLGVNNTDAENISVFPNPFTDQINCIVTSQYNEPITIQLYNSLGQEVIKPYIEQGKAGANNISLSLPASLANGLYVLRITTGDVTKTQILVH